VSSTFGWGTGVHREGGRSTRTACRAEGIAGAGCARGMPDHGVNDSARLFSPRHGGGQFGGVRGRDRDRDRTREPEPNAKPRTEAEAGVGVGVGIGVGVGVRVGVGCLEELARSPRSPSERTRSPCGCPRTPRRCLGTRCVDFRGISGCSTEEGRSPVAEGGRSKHA
jgi:hypothetical protein